MKAIMSLTELASYLGMSQASVYHLVAAGKIPGKKVGKQWRFSRESIDRWLQNHKAQPANVLVIEDDLLIRNLIAKALEEAGHRVTGASTVAEALALLQEIRFDIAFLDLLLPDGTGLDVVATAAQLQASPVIVVVTGHPEHDLIDKIRVLLPGIIVLEKPVRLETLLDLTAHSTSGKAQPKPREDQ